MRLQFPIGLVVELAGLLYLKRFQGFPQLIEAGLLQVRKIRGESCPVDLDSRLPVPHLIQFQAPALQFVSQSHLDLAGHLQPALPDPDLRLQGGALHGSIEDAFLQFSNRILDLQALAGPLFPLGVQPGAALAAGLEICLNPFQVGLGVDLALPAGSQFRAHLAQPLRMLQPFISQAAPIRLLRVDGLIHLGLACFGLGYFRSGLGPPPSYF